MATDIKTFSGKKESSINEIRITRFYGGVGVERGVSIQLTLDNDYIQLDNVTAKEFANKILECLAVFEKKNEGK